MIKRGFANRVFWVWIVTVGLAWPSIAVGAGSQDNASLADKMDALIEQTIEQGLAPGMAVVVVKDGKPLYLKGFGYADRESKRPVSSDTVFYIASSTKSFTGLAASLLHLRGTLDLDAPINRYVPGIRLHEGLSADRITLRDLLTHTHGVSNSGPITFRVAYSGQHTPELLFDLLHHHGPDQQGRAFKYGNIGYNLASMVMDRALGKSWKDVLEQEIFVPLGMQSTTGYLSKMDKGRLAMPYRGEQGGFKRLHYDKGDENMHAAGGLVTTASDLAHWLAANLQEGRLEGTQILPSDAFRAAHRPHAEQSNSFGPFQRTGYGLGWIIGSYGEDLFLHHFGGFSGFHSHIGFMPEQGIGVAVLVNSAGIGSLAANTVSQYAYDLLLGRPGLEARPGELMDAARERATQFRQRIAADRARRAKRPQVLPNPLDAYVGVFENEIMGRVEWKVAGGKLEARMGRLLGAVEVYDGPRNALRVEFAGSGRVALFEFGEGSKKAERFVFQGQKFERVKE